MRFVCDSCRAQYMISDDKVGAKGVKVRCKKCGYVILVRRPEPISAPAGEAQSSPMPHGLSDGPATAGQEEDPTGAGYGASREARRGILDGIADDEIGAVFDQVLSGSGSPSRSSDAGPDSDPNGQELTRGVDPGLLQKLLQSSQAVPDVDRQPPADSPAQENGASNDWFVAIDEKQVGPLSFEQLKEFWNRGEIGPDSLCWRAGLSDWITLSEAPELATLLAPKPNRPVIVAAAPVSSPGLAASGPVESAFSAGAPSKSVRLEPVAAAARCASSGRERTPRLARDQNPDRGRGRSIQPGRFCGARSSSLVLWLWCRCDVAARLDHRFVGRRRRFAARSGGGDYRPRAEVRIIRTSGFCPGEVKELVERLERPGIGRPREAVRNGRPKRPGTGRQRFRQCCWAAQSG